MYYDPTGHYGIAQWWNDMQEGWHTLTNKEERERSLQLIQQYGDGGFEEGLITFGVTAISGPLDTIESDLIQDPEKTLTRYNQEIAKPFIKNTLGIDENSKVYKAIKYVGIRAESTFTTATNLGKGVVQGSVFVGESIGTGLSPYFIEGSRKLGLFGLDNDDVYNYALNDAYNRIENVKKCWSAVPTAMATDYLNTFNAENAYNFLFNPDLSLHDAIAYERSVANTALTIYGAKQATCAAGRTIKSGAAILKRNIANMGHQPLAVGGYSSLAGNAAINNAIANSSRVAPVVGSGLMYAISRGVRKRTRQTNGIFGKNTVGAAEKYTPSNIKMINDKYLKKQGFDAHALKQDFVGKKNIAHFDIYVDKDSGMLWIYRKGGIGEPIPTYEYIK